MQKIVKVTQATMNVQCLDGVLDMRPIMSAFIIDMYRSGCGKPIIQHCIGNKLIFTWIFFDPVVKQNETWCLMVDEHGVTTAQGPWTFTVVKYADFRFIKVVEANGTMHWVFNYTNPIRKKMRPKL